MPTKSQIRTQIAELDAYRDSIRKECFNARAKLELELELADDDGPAGAVLPELAPQILFPGSSARLPPEGITRSSEANDGAIAEVLPAPAAPVAGYTPVDLQALLTLEHEAMAAERARALAPEPAEIPPSESATGGASQKEGSSADDAK